MVKNDKYNCGKLYYIHGYLSSPNSTKGKLFKKKLRAIPIKYRYCAPEKLIISDCIKKIKDTIKNDEDVTLIGSSLGGFLSAKTALECNNIKKLILLNPAIIPDFVDINKINSIPKNILSDMKNSRLFTEKIKSDIFVFLGTNDELVPNNWGIEFAIFQEATVKFLRDDHSFTNNINKLTELISNILNKKIN